MMQSMGILAAMMFATNTWAASDLASLNQMLRALDGFSLSGDGTVALNPSLWNKSTTRTANATTESFAHQGRSKLRETPSNTLGPEESILRQQHLSEKNNLVQIDYKSGKVVRVSQNVNSTDFLTASIQDGNITSITTCQSARCFTATQSLCSKILQGHTSFNEISLSLDACTLVRLRSRLSARPPS